jgi:iron complex outermembrane receptor protein
MKKQFVILLMVLGLFVFGKMGQAAEQATEPPLMKETVVTATRFEEEISTVPANVSVITKENIENSTAQDIPSILRTQAGIHVTDITGNRRTNRVDLRGFGETAQSNTLVLVDGRRINNPDLSGTDWAVIPLAQVERIEIIRGGRGSILYGDNATGGVINIITKEGDKFEAGAGVAYGSFDTVETVLSVSGSEDKLNYAIISRHYKSNGYRKNSETEAGDIGIDLGYFLSDMVKMNLRVGYHDDETGLPGALDKTDLDSGLVKRTDARNPEDFAEVDDAYAKLTPQIFMFQDSEFLIDLSLRERDSLFLSTFTGGEFEGDTEIRTVTLSPQFILKEEISGFKNNLTVGVDYTRSEEDIINVVTGAFPSAAVFELEKINHAYYIHDEFYPIDKLAISAGYRHDEVEFKFDPSTPDKTEFDEGLFTTGANYNFYRDSYVYISYSDSFRYPVLDELYNFFTNTVDTTLTPQTSDDYEIGIRHYFNQNFWANVNLFRVDTEDELFFNPTKGAFGANDNFDDEIRRDGAEIAAGMTFNKVSLRASYAYTDAEIQGGQFEGNEVPGVPEHQAAFDVIFEPAERWTIAFNGLYIGERLFESDFANEFDEQDEYFVLNAKCKYKWQNFTAFLDINNLLDEEYEEFGVLGSFPTQETLFPSPEINFLVGISAAF